MNVKYGKLSQGSRCDICRKSITSRLRKEYQEEVDKIEMDISRTAAETAIVSAALAAKMSGLSNDQLCKMLKALDIVLTEIEGAGAIQDKLYRDYGVAVGINEEDNIYIADELERIES